MSDKKIPKGIYCYFGSRNPKYKNYKPCPYWEWLGNNKARCNKFNIEDEYPQDCKHLLWDQVKIKECVTEEDYE